MRYAFRTWHSASNNHALSMMESQLVADRKQFMDEAQALKELHASEGGLAKKILEETKQKAEEMLRTAHEKTIEIKMVSAIRRLRDVTVEKKCAALRQWKMVHQFSVQAEGADRRKHDLLISQKNNMIKAGTSILTVWIKSRQRHACMKRFRNWKMHIFGILSQERTRGSTRAQVGHKVESYCSDD